ncbi:MAG: recombinase family protein [Flavobacterium sp.]|nr:MAG: recombinase family protein [Flavobacterium sp.]
MVKKAKVLYVRVSTADQKTDRQRISESEYDLIVEDTCSGATPFFERDGGKQILKLIEKDALGALEVWQIDRLGRNLRDIINTIHYFTERKIAIRFIAQGLCTMDEDGKENPISHMVIAIMGIIGQMERTQIRERQLEGIRIAKLKGAFKGRKKETKEDTLQFLSKPKNQKALEYIKKGYKAVEAAKLAGVHINTITKIKKLGLRVETVDS